MGNIMTKNKLFQFNKNNGFTLIELVVSIVIIGILASITVLSYPGIKKQMLISQINVDLRTAGTQLARDFSKNGKYPDSLAESADGKGIISSSDVTLGYSYYSSTNTYCLQGSNGTTIYRIESGSKNVIIGECASQKTFISTWGVGSEEYDNGAGITSTSDGGYVVVGQTYGFQGTKYAEAIISKYDSTGVLSWVRQLGGASTVDDRAFSVIESTDGKYIVAGNSYAFDEYQDVFIAVFTKTGALELFKTFGRNAYDSVKTIIKTADGGYLLVGSTAGTLGNINYDSLFIKLDSSLNTTWSRSWGGQGTEDALSAIQAKDGSYVICGTLKLYNVGQDDSFILKLNSNGDLAWEYRLESTVYGDHHINTVTQSTDGNFVIGGYSIHTGPVNRSALLAKITAQGQIVWLKTYAFASENFSVESVKLTQSGQYIVTGSNYLALFNQDGSLIWCKRITGSINNFGGKQIAQLDDGSYAITGSISVGSPSDIEFGIIKFNSDGDISNATVSDISITITSPTTISLNKQTYSSIKDVTQNILVNPAIVLSNPSGNDNRLVLP